MTTTPIETFRRQLAENRLGEVLSKLQQELDQTDYQEATVLLAARHAALQRKNLTGLITESESQAKESQLIDDCLQLLLQVEKGDAFSLKDPSEKPVSSSLKNVVGGDITNRDGTISIGDK
ncbi:MAG: hypothetical protein AAF433_16080 [Bacteroidota bacterium]